MRSLQYSRKSTEKFVVKGIVGDDNLTITYVDGDGVNREMTITDALERFAGQNVSISIQMNTEEDLLDEYPVGQED